MSDLIPTPDPDEPGDLHVCIVCGDRLPCYLFNGGWADGSHDYPVGWYCEHDAERLREYEDATAEGRDLSPLERETVAAILRSAADDPRDDDGAVLRALADRITAPAVEL